MLRQPDGLSEQSLDDQEQAALATRVVGYFPTWNGNVNDIWMALISIGSQQVPGQSKAVANGTSRASVWVRSSGGQINGIPVTNGNIEVGVYSDANAQNWAAFDQSPNVYSAGNVLTREELPAWR